MSGSETARLAGQSLAASSASRRTASGLSKSFAQREDGQDREESSCDPDRRLHGVAPARPEAIVIICGSGALIKVNVLIQLPFTTAREFLKNVRLNLRRLSRCEWLGCIRFTLSSSKVMVRLIGTLA